MIKTMLSALLITIAGNLHANESCSFKLLGNKWQDSYHHKVFVDDNSILTKKLAKKTVSDLFLSLNCMLQLDQGSTTCINSLETTICRVNIYLGYFIIFPDYVDSYNVVFNRWD